MKYCPKCKTSDIHPYLTGFLNAYKCKKCGYTGTLILEKNEQKIN